MSKTKESRREFWRQFVAQQQHSGMSVRAFCRQRGTSEHSFYQWRKRLAAQLPVKFALVEMNASSLNKALPLEVLLASGERLWITSGCDTATLRTVIEVLRESR